MTQLDDSFFRDGQFIQAGDLNVYYEEYGEGEPLVLLHGGMQSGRVGWASYLPSLADKFRVIVPDGRGHGRTENPTGDFSYRLMADDTAAFIGALKLGSPSIWGYSDGGQIALELGMRYPDLTRALVVGAAMFKFSEGYMQAMRAFLGDEDNPEVDTDKLESESPQLVEYAREVHKIGGPDYWKVLLRQIKPMWTTPLNYTEADFRKITSSTLIMVGDRDEGIPVEEAVEMYRMIPNSELYVIPDAGHLSTQTELSGHTALDFLLRHSDGSSAG